MHFSTKKNFTNYYGGPYNFIFLNAQRTLRAENI